MIRQKSRECCIITQHANRFSRRCNLWANLHRDCKRFAILHVVSSFGYPSCTRNPSIMNARGLDCQYSSNSHFSICYAKSIASVKQCIRLPCVVAREIGSVPRASCSSSLSNAEQFPPHEHNMTQRETAGSV